MTYEQHSFNDGIIELEYTCHSDKHTDVILELYRGKLFCNIIKDFINDATQLLGTKIFSVKKSFPRTLTNLLSSWMFNLYASENFNPNIDPFLPNNHKETDSLKLTLLDLVKYDPTIKNADSIITNLLHKLVKIFSDQLNLLNNYKNSSYYTENKNKYTILKKEIEQKREDKLYKFYKYLIKINFEIKDKRLLNILDNLLIPFDEYDKLKSNFVGKESLMNEYIWIILYRYQLLGSNNHQLGVKSDIMSKMKKDFNLNYECFASAINCTFAHYCSIYHDVEKHFGSFGSFFNLTPIGGTFGLNPPYQKDIIEMALNKALEWLEDADENKKILTFIITIPIWDNEGKKIMKETFHNELPQQNIDYGDFVIIEKIKKSNYHRITKMIPKENFTYIDHNFKLLKNKTIQNTYVIIMSTDVLLNTSYLSDYNFS
jgi:hypothetical protein